MNTRRVTICLNGFIAVRKPGFFGVVRSGFAPGYIACGGSTINKDTEVMQ